MTVISAWITRVCTTHASDSLITELQSDSTYKPTEWTRSKIVPVRQWRGAMAYWGLATYSMHGWSTYDWLSSRASEAGGYSSAEEFASALTTQLNDQVSKMKLKRPTDAGIGIHFTAYEHIDDYWIPELFLISNWAGESYTALRPEGIGLSRETYHVFAQQPPKEEHREREYRLRIHKFLNKGKSLFYNNGDPPLFNHAANALFDMYGELGRRGRIATPQSVDMHLAMARRPIEIVSRLQGDFCAENKRVVGGKPHDLAITPNGDYRSSTGDLR